MRDLWRLRGQVLAVAMVIASGIAVMVMSLSAMEALDETARAYYERYRFAHVFATAKRVPERIARRIELIPGVQSVETRIADVAILDIAGFEEPVLGQVISIPEREEAVLNRLALRSGRLVGPDRPDEVVLNEPFAEAHGLAVGDQLHAVLNGHRRTLDVVGIALSPEFVYAIGPGALMPDDQRFGVLWMGREALAAAFDLDGAFNDVAISILRGTEPKEVVDRLDTILARYGGTGAYERADQISNWFLMNEIEQLHTMSTVLPAIFLAVAAFLTNMVLARLIATERSEIGLLKAFGYSDWAVSWHYVKLVAGMVALGAAMGWAVGFWLGYYNTRIYADFYQFPFLYFHPGSQVFVGAAAISLAAAMMGALGAVRWAAALAPAEAMQPPAPPRFRQSGLSILLARWLDQPTRIILRQIVRWPLRAFLTTTGIAMSVAVLIMAFQWLDAINHMIEVNFFQAQRQDITLGLAEPESLDTLQELVRLPGVMAAEPFRGVRARLRNGNYTKRESIQGVLEDARLNPVYDTDLGPVTVPAGGLVISSKLAEVLKVGRGDLVTVEVLEGRRPVRDLRVLATFDTYIGTPAYMEISDLNRMMGEGPRISGAQLLVDAQERPALYRKFKTTPKIAAVSLRRAAVDMFNETMGRMMLIFISFFVGFAATLAVGTTYNSARIALSERGRDLATLRVLGFSRAEVSYILLGEVALLTVAAMPLGCLLGYVLAATIVSAFDTELFRVPMVIEPSTYGYAVILGLLAAALTAALVRLRVNRLDLIAVLKTRE
jgi:putative ABC transport system permease protein